MEQAAVGSGPANAPTAIRLRDVSKSYREGERQHVVLDAISAEVAAGETIALLGSSGSGKSTLLNLISGIDQPDAGAIELAGTRITELDERERTLYRRRNLGFVFQFFNLLPTLTVVENVRLPLELNGIDASGSERRAMELLDAVGLAVRSSSFPERLSGGEQQRVAIARALAHAPSLVLADEPTGNLDEETGEQVLAVLRQMLVEQGATMVLATHSRERGQNRSEGVADPKRTPDRGRRQSAVNLLAKTSLRYLPRHPWQLAVALLGIALGVAVIVAVDLANSSAQRAFLQAVDAVYGEATHQIVGGPAGYAETEYVALRLDGGVRASAPVVEGFVSIAGRTFNLLGVDPFAEAGFRDYRIGSGGQGRAWLDLVSLPGAFVLDEQAAARLGVGVGDTVVVTVAGQQRPGFLAATLATEGGRPGLGDVVISDIATAQEWLGWNGRLSRVDLRIDANVEAARVAALLPQGSQLLSAAGRSRQTLGMTRSFSTSLTAMSLLAVLVGVFLIYNSVSFTVIQRRPLLGVMRSLGVTREEIAGLIVAEGLLLGVVGVAAGIALGLFLSRELLGLVTQSINDHYYYVGAASVQLSPWSVAKGIVAGIGASLLAAAVPAWEAAQSPPRQALARASLEQRVSDKLGLVEFSAIAATAAGAVALLVTARSLVVGFAGMFLIVVGLALLVPGIVAFLSRRLAGPVGRIAGLSGRMAVQGIGRSLSRTGIAVTALAVAVAATIGVDVMVGSFRGSVDAWLQRSVNADMYVAPPRLAGGRAERAIDPLLLRRIVALPEVDHVGVSRSVDVVARDGVRRLLAVDMTPEYRSSARLTARRSGHGMGQVSIAALPC